MPADLSAFCRMINVETNLVEPSLFGRGQRAILESAALYPESGQNGLVTIEPINPNYIKVAKSSLNQTRFVLTHENRQVLNWVQDSVHHPVTFLLHFRRCLF